MVHAFRLSVLACLSCQFLHFTNSHSLGMQSRWLAPSISHMSGFISNMLYGRIHSTRFLLLAKHGRRIPLPCAAIIYCTSSTWRSLLSSGCYHLHGSLSPCACRSKESMNKQLCFNFSCIDYLLCLQTVMYAESEDSILKCVDSSLWTDLRRSMQSVYKKAGAASSIAKPSNGHARFVRWTVCLEAASPREFGGLLLGVSSIFLVFFVF